MKILKLLAIVLSVMLAVSCGPEFPQPDNLAIPDFSGYTSFKTTGDDTCKTLWGQKGASGPWEEIQFTNSTGVLEYFVYSMQTVGNRWAIIGIKDINHELNRETSLFKVLLDMETGTCTDMSNVLANRSKKPEEELYEVDGHRIYGTFYKGRSGTPAYGMMDLDDGSLVFLTKPYTDEDYIRLIHFDENKIILKVDKEIAGSPYEYWLLEGNKVPRNITKEINELNPGMIVTAVSSRYVYDIEKGKKYSIDNNGTLLSESIEPLIPSGSEIRFDAVNGWTYKTTTGQSFAFDSGYADGRPWVYEIGISSIQERVAIEDDYAAKENDEGLFFINRTTGEWTKLADKRTLREWKALPAGISYKIYSNALESKCVFLDGRTGKSMETTSSYDAPYEYFFVNEEVQP